MNVRALLTAGLALFGAALHGVAAPTCNPGQTPQGDNCTLLVSLGWEVAGQGNASILSFYVPPNASGPVTFNIVGLSSNLGSTYNGYFAIRAGLLGGQTQVLTLADMISGGGETVHPGRSRQFIATQVCWDPSCTSAAPDGAVANMFSMQILIATPNPNDINPFGVETTVQFLDGNNRVTFEAAESAIRSNAPVSIVPGISLGATPDARYISDNSAVTAPYDAFSISNLNNNSPIQGTLTVEDSEGNPIANAAIPPIPAGGAAGYLVVERYSGDPLGLIPSTTVLPTGTDGVFHGMLVIVLSGLTPTGQTIVLAQEYNGHAMLNLPVFHSPHP